MATVTCKESGLTFEASTKRTQQHPAVAALKTRANRDGNYAAVMGAIETVRAAGGYTTAEEFVTRVAAIARGERDAKIDARLAAEREAEARREAIRVRNVTLRTAGYVWHKSLDADDGFEGLSGGEFYLVAPDGVEVSVSQALDEIARGREVVRAEIAERAEAERAAEAARIAAIAAREAAAEAERAARIAEIAAKREAAQAAVDAKIAEIETVATRAEKPAADRTAGWADVLVVGGWYVQCATNIDTEIWWRVWSEDYAERYFTTSRDVPPAPPVDQSIDEYGLPRDVPSEVLPKEKPTMKLINLTPHSVAIRAESGAMITVPPTTPAARCAAPRAERPALDVGNEVLPVSLVEYGQVENLPAPAEGVGYVVSGLVLSQIPSRADCFAPGEAIREAAYSAAELADVDAALELCDVDPALRARVLSALKSAQGRVIGAQGLSCTPAYPAPAPVPPAAPEPTPDVVALEAPAENIEPLPVPAPEPAPIFSTVRYPEGWWERYGWGGDIPRSSWREEYAADFEAAWAALKKGCDSVGEGTLILPEIPAPIWEGKIEVSPDGEKYRVVWEGHPAEDWRRMPGARTRTGRPKPAFYHGQAVWWAEGRYGGPDGSGAKWLIKNAIDLNILKQEQHSDWLRAWAIDFAPRLVAAHPDKCRIEGQKIIRLDVAPRKSPFQK